MLVPNGANANTWCYDCSGWKTSYSGTERKAACSATNYHGKFRLTMLGSGDAELRSVEGVMPEGMSFETNFGSNTYYSTGIDRGGWYMIMNPKGDTGTQATAALQPDCNKQGFNLKSLAPWKHMKLGYLMNENGGSNCGSNDSGIGIGFGNPSYTAGSYCTCCTRSNVHGYRSAMCVLRMCCQPWAPFMCSCVFVGF